jgi:ribokinase
VAPVQACIKTASVDDAGENSIAVLPGANGLLSPADVDAAERLIASAAVVVMQLEVPVETVRHAAAICRRLGVATILDPAPAPPAGLPAELYDVDILTPNETEAAMLLGTGPLEAESSANEIAGRLLQHGSRAVVLKLGAAGAQLLERDSPAAGCAVAYSSNAPISTIPWLMRANPHWSVVSPNDVAMELLPAL